MTDPKPYPYKPVSLEKYEDLNNFLKRLGTVPIANGSRAKVIRMLEDLNSAPAGNQVVHLKAEELAELPIRLSHPNHAWTGTEVIAVIDSIRE